MSIITDQRARKLAPLYHALEARNYKAVIKHCSKKDIQRWDVVKVLKAHALERIGQVQEALDICNEVKAKAPTDSSVLKPLLMVYKATDHLEDVAACLEAAIAQQPGNVERGNELLHCYCQQGSYNNCQQLSSKLYKQTNLTVYLFWAAAAIVLQVRNGGTNRMLQLALLIAQKAFEEAYEKAGTANTAHTSAPPSGGELGFYVYLLQEQGENERARETLQRYASSGKSSVPPSIVNDETDIAEQARVPMTHMESLRWQGRLLLEAAKWEDAQGLFRSLLRVHQDDWSSWLGLMEALRGLNRQEDGIQEALDGIQQNQRTLCLAKMEFCKQSPGHDRAHKIGRLLSYYVERYGSQACCLHNISRYLEVLRPKTSQAARETFVDGLLSANEGLCSDEAGSIGSQAAQIQPRRQLLAELHQLTTIQRILYFLESSGPKEQWLLGTFHTVSDIYEKLGFLSEEMNGNQAQVKPADELLILMCQQLTDLGTLADGRSDWKAAAAARFDALSLLEQALRRSPHNTRLRIFLVELYGFVGGGQLLLRHFNQLVVKQVQVDTLSWLVLPACLGLGFWTEAQQQCQQILAFHKLAASDAQEHLTAALKHGTYLQALEMEQFQREKLASSLQLALAKVTLVSLRLAMHMHDHNSALQYLKAVAVGLRPESVDPLSQEGDRLSDNRDFSVGVGWIYLTSAEQDTARRQRRQQSVQRVLLFSALQSLLLKALHKEGRLLKASLGHLEKSIEESFSQHKGHVLQSGLQGYIDIDSYDGFACCLAALTAAAELYTDALDEKRALSALQFLQTQISAAHSNLRQQERPVGSPVIVRQGAAERLCAISNFLHTASAPLTLLLAQIDTTHGSACSGHGRGKKRGESAPDDPVALAVIAAVSSWKETLAFLSSYLLATIQGEAAEDMGSPARIECKFEAESESGFTCMSLAKNPDFADLRAALSAQLSESRAQSASRLLEVVEAKLKQLI